MADSSAGTRVGTLSRSHNLTSRMNQETGRNSLLHTRNARLLPLRLRNHTVLHRLRTWGRVFQGVVRPERAAVLPPPLHKHLGIEQHVEPVLFQQAAQPRFTVINAARGRSIAPLFVVSCTTRVLTALVTVQRSARSKRHGAVIGHNSGERLNRMPRLRRRHPAAFAPPRHAIN